jgi:hypothetical protein
VDVGVVVCLQKNVHMGYWFLAEKNKRQGRYVLGRSSSTITIPFVRSIMKIT